MRAQMNNRLLASLATLAMAMRVGAAALSQSSPTIVKRSTVASLKGLVADGVASFKGIPFCGAAHR